MKIIKILLLNYITKREKGRQPFLLREIHFFHECGVAGLVLALQVLEVSPAVGYHLDEAAAGMVVFLVLLQMLGESVYLARQNSHLNFRRTGIFLVNLAFLDYRLLFLGC